MNLPDPLTRTNFYHTLLWAIAALLLIVGFYLSQLRFMNSEWLTRAGCLVVMLGIWSSLGGIMQERLLTSRMKWRHRKKLKRARKELKKQKLGSTEIEAEIAKLEDEHHNRSLEITQKLRLSLGVLEISLLLTGTFVWGFGDLLV